MDNRGRIVIPKSIRDRLALRKGSKFEIEECLQGILLKPVHRRLATVKKNGLWVHLGRVPLGFDWDNLVDADREERIEEILEQSGYSTGR